MKSWWLGILLELWVSKYYPVYMTFVVGSHQTAEWNIRSEHLTVCGPSPKPGSTPLSYLVLPPSLDRKQTSKNQTKLSFCLFNLWFWGLACTLRSLVWTFDFMHVCLCLSVIGLVLWLQRTFLFLTSAVLQQTSKQKPVTEVIMCYTPL